MAVYTSRNFAPQKKGKSHPQQFLILISFVVISEQRVTKGDFWQTCIDSVFGFLSLVFS